MLLISVLVSKEDDEKKEEILFDLVRKRYDDDWERLKGLQEKAGNLIGYVSIVTGLLLGLATLEIIDKLTQPHYFLSYFGGIILLLSSIVFSLIAVKVKKWKAMTDISEIEKMLEDKDYGYRTVMTVGISEIGKIVKKNESAINNKASWVELSWYCLVVGLVLIFIYVVFLTVRI